MDIRASVASAAAIGQGPCHLRRAFDPCCVAPPEGLRPTVDEAVDRLAWYSEELSRY